jgi:post-segregation antitoxin (ccd killing protein)
VTISELPPSIQLDEERLCDRLTPLFALYLQQYPQVCVIIDGRRLDPSGLQAHRYDLEDLAIPLPDGGNVLARITVIEWSTSRATRSLWLCDQDGFSLHELSPGIQAPGFAFTAYVRSAYFRDLASDGLLDSELAPGRERVLEAVRKQLRDNFRRRAAEQARSAVERWREEQVYPYTDKPSSSVEIVEREVFDICALNVSDQVPDFEKSDPKQKRLAFRLLRQAIEQNPSSLQAILAEVLGLPKEKQDELAALLKQSTLSSIINASKVVSDRLNFLAGLEELLFQPDNKKRLLERTQLHRILAPNTWLFGEEFNLTVDDESLNTALARHLDILGRPSETVTPVLREDGAEGVLDLMLSRVLQHPHAQRREHLVVELKRPKQPVNSKVLQQVKDYAFAVARDDRFVHTETSWRFVAISNELSDSVAREARQRGRPRGLIYEDSEIQMTVYVHTWSQIIQDARGRLEFFREALNLSVSADAGREHLRQVYDKYLPKDGPGKTTPSDPKLEALLTA